MINLISSDANQEAKMAIGFARLEFVKRSERKNACAKAAYNARTRIHFIGNETVHEKIYDWSFMEKPIYHEIIVPKHVADKFKNTEILWNAIESKETRINSQTALDIVIALPDDEMISTEDRIELAKTFVEKHLVENGLAAQIDIHQPKDNGDGKSGHNWHAHILVTTRRFSPDGKEIGEKARDLMPVVRGGKVISGPNWERLWTSHQNQFFESKGLSLKVDIKGAVSQIHLGPIRMRARAFALLEENEIRTELNYLEATKPEKILERITETKSVFSPEDVERFLVKHVDPKNIAASRNNFWKQDNIVELIDKETKVKIGKFTTQQIHDEESKIIRLADRIQTRNAFLINKQKAYLNHTNGLTKEQKLAFENIIDGMKLSCIEGHAGTGKSYLLGAIKNAYEANGYVVRAFGPDNATVDVLKEKGFENTENVYRFLFAFQKEKRVVASNKEVWIIDEAGKLGNRALIEILKVAEKHKVQLILSGCSAQLASVERGGMFKVFCEKYGAEVLEDIQRQKDEEQRNIAKQLAKGKMSVAIDQLVAAGGIKWANDKKEAIEELIKKWSMDRLSSSSSMKDIIIAHTNAEVRVLNEMVRLYRKEQGEIAEKEYQCETPSGKIYVSVGDKIEFKKNNQELGVTNGMSGILTQASHEKFVVSVKINDKNREIAFNPSTYPYFQLGYAKTFNKSQGDTAYRGYVLHSPQMNKEKTYVGLTRHVDKVFLFVSKTDAKCLADLKRQAYRASQVENSLSYTTFIALKNDEKQQATDKQIQQLKASDSIFAQAKGHSLSAWSGLVSVTSKIIEKHQDRVPSKQFFNPKLEEAQQSGKNKVIEVRDEEAVNSKQIVSEIIEKQKQLKLSSNAVLIEKKNQWGSLPESAKQLLQEYQKSWQDVAALRSHFSDKKHHGVSLSHLQEASARRNELASIILQKISKEDLKNVLGDESFEIILERAYRYESSQQKKENFHEGIDEKLKSNIESLLFKLFPEGPSRRDRDGYRYGAKGSLSVSCRGKNAGCYHDFEKGEGGGPIQLIQRTLGIGYPEAKEWARNFLGEAKEIPMPSRFNHVNAQDKKHEEWISLKPPVITKAPPLEQISAKLDSQYQEVSRHAYHDEQGNVLFYTLRLHEKDNKESKTVLPLSYGYWNGEKDNPCWWLKGYQSTDGKPLYNLHELTKNRTAVVLVVEGEKTTDAAKAMFKDENIVCVTWSGGSSAVSKTDWAPLYGRKVIIWPDNDVAGFKAAEDICSTLRKVGVKSLEVVDKNILANELPAKWDLADPLPQGKGQQFIRDTLLRTNEKMVNSDQFLLTIDPDRKLSAIDRLQAQDVLRNVEERVRPSLEKKETTPWKIHEQVIKEAQKVYSEQQSIEKTLLENNISGDLCKRLAYHIMLCKAKIGESPTQCKVSEMAQTLTNLCNVQDKIFSEHKKEIASKEIYTFAFDKLLSTSFASDRYYSKDSVDSLYKLFKNDTYTLAKNIQINIESEQNIQPSLFKDKSPELSIPV